MSKAGNLTFTTRGSRDIVLKRVFEAPRDAVWQAFTQAALIKTWLSGPPAGALTIRHLDARVGGGYRWEWQRGDGSTMGLGGGFREIVEPARIVHTETWDQPFAIGETVVTTVFAEQNGKTAITITIHYATRAARDAMAQSGMAAGMEQCYARLDALFVSHGADKIAS